MACISDEEKNCLYDIVRTELGAPIRKIELTDNMLDILLKVSIEDYARLVQNWLIDNQWPGLVGLDVGTERVGLLLVGLLVKQLTRLDLQHPLGLCFRHCLCHSHLVDQAAVC